MGRIWGLGFGAKGKGRGARGEGGKRRKMTKQTGNTKVNHFT